MAQQQLLNKQPMQPQPQQTVSPLIAQLKNPPMGSPQVSQTQPSAPALPTGPQTSVAGLNQPMNPQKERTNIWSGFIEWHEKQKGKFLYENVFFLHILLPLLVIRDDLTNIYLCIVLLSPLFLKQDLRMGKKFLGKCLATFLRMS